MKNLVIAPIGNGNCVEFWVKDTQNFDLALLDYSEKGIIYKPNCKYYRHLKGYKWHMIKQFLPEVIDKYDTFFFPDDDIFCNTFTINNLFAFFNTHNFSLAQPSLTANSFFSWQITKRKGDNYRLVSHVEVMCPIMTKDTLKKLLHTFDINDSSWGIDLLWSHILDYKNIAIIDKVAVWHSQQIGSRDLYKKQITPKEDMEAIIKKYQLNKPFFIELK